jgi:hypothetical protein
VKKTYVYICLLALLALPLAGTATTIKNIHAHSGWISYGEYPPNYSICPGPCPGISYSIAQHLQSPALSGNSTKFSLGGTKSYVDVLWTKGMIGQKSSEGMPDSNHKLLTTFHSFVYDTYFYGKNLELSQVLEFDINQYFNGVGLIWGTQCRIAGGHGWDIWNNVTKHWVSAGIPCHPISGGWNHLVLRMSRTANNSLLYQSITLNGVTYNLNKIYPHGYCPKNWWGLSVNFQTDGDRKPDPYQVYLDNFNFTYQ